MQSSTEWGFKSLENMFINRYVYVYSICVHKIEPITLVVSHYKINLQSVK